MRTTCILLGLCLNAWLATAQAIEPNRLLTAGYQPQPVEQALITLRATNTVSVSTSVEYKAGQSVILQPGFEAQAGSVFLAHTGTIRQVGSTEHEAPSLTFEVYPNPVEQTTTITYVLTRPSRTSLAIYDLEGKLISQLVDHRYQEAGHYAVEWQGSSVPTGTYVCTLDINLQRLSKRIIRK